MRFLLYTDNHFCQYSSILRSRSEVYSTRLENQVKSVNWAEQLAVDSKCDAIIHLGDFFDRPELNAEEITALKDIKWADLPHHFLVGNHELGMNDLSYNSAQALSMVPKATIVDKPTEWTGFGYRMILLPYILEMNRRPLEDYIKELVYKPGMFETQEYKRTIILSHNDIKGIRYGQYESKVGFDISEIYSNCDLFVNGHIHNQQQINNKIFNLGNLTGQNFSEDAFKYSHCAAILDTDTLKLDLINNPYSLNFYKLEFVDDNFEVIDKLKENAIVSIKVYAKYVGKLKELLASNENILSYRIITIPDAIKSEIQVDKPIVKVDHIEQFKTFIKNNVEDNGFLDEELSFIR